MKLLQRIGYYLGGFALGLIILAFFFNKKRTSCSYGPEARVLKNIRSKKLIYAQSINLSDTLLIKDLLKEGSINFSKSEPRKEPCGIYLIEGSHNTEISLQVQNCDDLVTILKINR